MSDLENIRWGVLGLGWFGEVHADTLSTTPGVELMTAATESARTGKIVDI